jgi:hypothetical protein
MTGEQGESAARGPGEPSGFRVVRGEIGPSGSDSVVADVPYGQTFADPPKHVFVAVERDPNYAQDVIVDAGEETARVPNSSTMSRS